MFFDEKIKGYELIKGILREWAKDDSPVPFTSVVVATLVMRTFWGWENMPLKIEHDGDTIIFVFKKRVGTGTWKCVANGRGYLGDGDFIPRVFQVPLGFDYEAKWQEFIKEESDEPEFNLSR